MQDLVSIIVPVYNERQYLEMCVDSILKSTWSNIEIILVDDGSEKEVYDLCNRIALKNEKCRCIHQKNMGLSSARVAGFYASHGEWITFVDNDDVVSPFLVEKLIGEIGEDIDIIMGQRIDTETPEKIDWIKETVQSQTYDGKTVCTMIAHDPEQKKVITPIWGKLYRRKFLLGQEIEKYKNKCPVVYFEDVLITPILFYNARRICIIGEAIYAHREISTSISRSGKISAFYLDQIESGNILCEFFREKSMTDMYNYTLDLYLFSILRIYCLAELERDYGYYKKRIEGFYKKYIKDYLISKNKLSKKVVAAFFGANHWLWRKAVKYLYFKRF